MNPTHSENKNTHSSCINRFVSPIKHHLKYTKQVANLSCHGKYVSGECIITVQVGQQCC